MFFVVKKMEGCLNHDQACWELEDLRNDKDHVFNGPWPQQGLPKNLLCNGALKCSIHINVPQHLWHHNIIICGESRSHGGFGFQGQKYRQIIPGQPGSPVDCVPLPCIGLYKPCFLPTFGDGGCHVL